MNNPRMKDLKERHDGSILDITDLIRNSILVESQPNFRSNKKSNTARYHNFYVPIKVGNDLYAVRITAEEDKSNLGKAPMELELYDVIINKKADSRTSHRMGILADSLPSKITIRDLLRNVKDAHGQPFINLDGSLSQEINFYRNANGSYNQMAGERANTAMISRLQKAEYMEREAASSKEIWKETGWMRGSDHKWRFEIPDSLDKINFRKDVKPHTLGEIYDNPALYEAYPELAQKTVRMEDTKTVETLSKGNAAVKKSAEGSALIFSKMAENFHKNYGVPLKMVAVKIMEETNNKLGRLPQQTYSDKNLEKDSQFFMRQVQEAKEGKLTGDKIHVMRTPLVMKLVGAKILPVTLSARKLAKILENHRESVNDRMLSQLPKALSDPMMVIRSYDGANGEARKVFVLDLKDDNGATMVVPVQLDTNYGEYKVNRIISYYAKNERASGKPAYDFFKTNIELGNVEYVNKKKTTQWYASEEVNSSIPEGLMSSLFNQNIPNENDLVKLKKKHRKCQVFLGNSFDCR